MADVRMDDDTILTGSVLRSNRVPVDMGDGRPHTATLGTILALGIGIWFGTQAEFDALDPGLKRTYAEWKATGVGYFEFHVFTAESGDVAVTALTTNIPLIANIPTISIPGVVSVAALTTNIPLIANIPTITIPVSGTFSESFDGTLNTDKYAIANTAGTTSDPSSACTFSNSKLLFHIASPSGWSGKDFISKSVSPFPMAVGSGKVISFTVTTPATWDYTVNNEFSFAFCPTLPASSMYNEPNWVKFAAGTGDSAGMNGIAVAKRIAGVEGTVSRVTTTSFAPNTQYNVEITLTASNMAIKINGAVIISSVAHGMTLSEFFFGMWFGHQSTGFLDLTVDSLVIS